jgi:hypothetical protein
MLTPTTILARAASWNLTSLAAMFISPEIYLERKEFFARRKITFQQRQ